MVATVGTPGTAFARAPRTKPPSLVDVIRARMEIIEIAMPTYSSLHFPSWDWFDRNTNDGRRSCSNLHYSNAGIR